VGSTVSGVTALVRLHAYSSQVPSTNRTELPTTNRILAPPYELQANGRKGNRDQSAP
jgi:hypothetical protein